MAIDKNMEGLGIEVQTTGIERSISSFNKLAKSIETVVRQLDKLTSRLSGVSSKMSSVTRMPKNSMLKQQKGYSKGYLDLAKSGTLGDLGEFLLADPNQIQRAVLKQKTNLDKAYLLAGGRTPRRLNKFNTSVRGVEFSMLPPKMPEQLSKATSSIKFFNSELEKTQKRGRKTSNSLWQLSKRIATLTTLIYTASRVARVVRELVQESGSWIENLNLFAVTFGESNYREVLDWTTQYAEKLGVANNEILKMTGYFKQLSTAIGITGEQGTELSTILTQLTYDFGSFYNVSFDAVYEKLQAGIFSGQVRTLRTLGIDVSQASIQNLLDTNEALKGLNLSATKLTQTQKVLARTILTMQAGSNAFGDLARSIETLQNRQRVFTASLQNLKLALGDFFTGPANDLLAYGIAFVQTMTSILRTIVPLKTELEYDMGDNVFTEISEDIEEVEASLGLLSFDKFQSLSSSNKEQTNVTEALNALLSQQISKYEEVSSQFSGIDEKVRSIKETIWKWIFPNTTIEQIKDLINGLEDGATLSDKVKIVLGETNATIQSVIDALIRIVEIGKQIFAEIILPIMQSGIIDAVVTLLGALVSVADILGILKPLLVGIFTMNIIKKLGLANKAIVKVGNSVKQVNTALAFTAGFSIANTILGSFEKEGKVIASVILLIASAVFTLSVALSSLQGPVKLAMVMAGIGVAMASVAGIISGAKQMQGYITGGIPAKSELFYMNEYGIPEALINTGGRETNVINQQQLGSLVEQGFVRAIYTTGLLDAMQNKIIVEGNNVNDNAFARAIFPALKTESRRRGGNQL